MPEITDEEIDQTIAGLRYPKFAAFVVRRLMKIYGLSWDDAREKWIEHVKRTCPLRNTENE